jgi:RNA polymerase sigma-70 factor (ECF subfamily)
VDYSALDDTTLIRLIVRADQDALGELYDRFNRLVFSLALATVGDRETAEEITLDVFTRVWTRARTYRVEQAKVSTWLTSITRYRAIDELRRRKARPEQHSVQWAEMSANNVPSVDGPEKAVPRLLQRQRVRAAIAELPAEQKQALVLAYFQGYTHREIGHGKNADPIGHGKVAEDVARGTDRRLKSNARPLAYNTYREIIVRRNVKRNAR